MEKPRIILQRTKNYHHVPEKYVHHEGSAELYKVAARFPAQNPHWQYDLIEYQGQEFLLESISETFFNEDGLPTHEFRESKEGIDETSSVYIKAENGSIVVVRANSEGHTFISTQNYEGDWDKDPYRYSFINGHSNDLESGAMTAEQVRCFEIEDRYAWGDGSNNMTPEEIKEAEEIIANSTRRDVLSSDEYGSPLIEIVWDCDEIERYELHEYIYAQE